MKKGKSSTLIRLLEVIAIGLILVVLVFLLLSGTIYKLPNSATGKATEFDALWEYTASDGSKKTTQFPATIDVKKDAPVVVSTTLPAEILEGTKLYLFTFCDSSVYIGDEEVLNFDTSENPLPGPLAKSVGFFVNVKKEDANKTLKIVNTANSQYNNKFYKMYIGDSYGIYKMMFYEHGVQLAICLVFLIVSLAIISISLYYRIAYKRKTYNISLGIGTFLVAAWLIFDSKFFQILFDVCYIDGIMCFLCVMLVSFPYIAFMNSVHDGRHQKIYIVDSFISLGNFIVFTSLHFSGTLGFYESMPYMNCVMFITLLIPFIFVIVDIIKGKAKEYAFVAFGIIGLFVFGVLEFIGSNFFFEDTGVAILPGMALLLIMSLGHAIKKYIGNEREKERAVNENLQKTQFLARMTHEIRTPINSVIGMNEMILREAKDPQIKSYSNQIKTSSKLLLSLVNDVLDISRIEAGKMKIIEDEYDTRNALMDLINILRERAKAKGLRVNINISNKIPKTLKGDILHIKQILINFLSNAVKYTDVGSVSFSVEVENVFDNKVTLKFRVKDTGIGIREEDKNKLFQQFTRIDEKINKNIEGTGLGLNIVKNLSDAMGGRLHVNSKYNFGSTFYFTVGQEIVNEELIENVELINCRYSNSKNTFASFVMPEANILVVDDKNENIVVMRELLKRSHAKLDIALNGKDAIFKCRQNKYNLIFMDHTMPIMDGIECFEIIKKDKIGLNNDTPVVILTANAAEGDRTKYLKEGFDDYLTKPIDIEELEYCLTSLIPSDLVEYIEATDESTAVSSDDNAVINGLKSITSMDYNMTLERFSNDEKAVLEILNVVCKEGFENLNKMRTAFDNKDFAMLSIVCHSIKGVMATIYADQLALEAKGMEMAAKENQKDYVYNNIFKFCDNYESLINQIADTIEVDNADDTKENSGANDLDINDCINEACAYIVEYRQEKALDVLRQILDFAKDKELKKSVKEAYDYLDDFEYEKAREILESYLQGV